MSTSLVSIGNIEPGGTEWLTRMSASKVAAALGLSPWESPFSLWHKMAGNVPRKPETTEQSRGHYLEPAIVRWFADQHPEWEVEGPCPTYVHPERDWQAAAPDALVHKPKGVTSLLEVKTDAGGEPWGAAGTDDVPIYYRVQAIWQMDVTGARSCHIGLLTSFLEFREYFLTYDADEAEQIRTTAKAFLDSVQAGDEPPLDGMDATYQTLRQLHPDIDPGDIDVPDHLARLYCEAKHGLATAKKADTHATSELAAFMGNARRAMYAGKSIATRQVRGDGLPFLKASPGLPTFTDETETAA